MGWPDGVELAEYVRVAEGVGNIDENPYVLGSYGYWVVQDILFDRFMATRPARLEELSRLVAGSGGPVLDGSVESLAELDEWLRGVLRGPFDDGVDWDVVWEG
ncbi:MAG: hypothetical protein LBJ62_03800, partial [Bifidobacteriaceae bacterium]|nr:hypothetical protein [Bifidobacteriaceae bacterium]